MGYYEEVADPDVWCIENALMFKIYCRFKSEVPSKQVIKELLHKTEMVWGRPLNLDDFPGQVFNRLLVSYTSYSRVFGVNPYPGGYRGPELYHSFYLKHPAMHDFYSLVDEMMKESPPEEIKVDIKKMIIKIDDELSCIAEFLSPFEMELRKASDGVVNRLYVRHEDCTSYVYLFELCAELIGTYEEKLAELKKLRRMEKYGCKREVA